MFTSLFYSCFVCLNDDFGSKPRRCGMKCAKTPKTFLLFRVFCIYLHPLLKREKV